MAERYSRFNDIKVNISRSSKRQYIFNLRVKTDVTWMLLGCYSWDEFNTLSS